MTEQDAAAPAQTLQGEPGPVAPPPAVAWQIAVGVVIAVAAALLAWATWQLPAQPMQLDGGARLVPGLCAGVLCLCGGWLVWEALHGGWRHLPASTSAAHLQITPWVWVTAGLLLCALLMRQSGFVCAAALCYVLALQGLRAADQPGLGVRGARLVTDGVVGLLLAAVVYALFTKVLGISLPAGWLPWM